MPAVFEGKIVRIVIRIVISYDPIILSDHSNPDPTQDHNHKIMA